MATDTTEFVSPQIYQGQLVPVYPLPHVNHTALAVGTTISFNAATKFIRLLPGEDVRVAFTTDGTDPSPSSSNMPLKAGQQYDFAVTVKGMKMKAIAG